MQVKLVVVGRPCPDGCVDLSSSCGKARARPKQFSYGGKKWASIELVKIYPTKSQEIRLLPTDPEDFTYFPSSDVFVRRHPAVLSRFITGSVSPVIYVICRYLYSCS